MTRSVPWGGNKCAPKLAMTVHGTCNALGFPVECVFRIKVSYAGITRFQVAHDDADATAYVLSHAGGLATAPG